jgi:hypothetical protein
MQKWKMTTVTTPTFSRLRHVTGTEFGSLKWASAADKHEF